MAGQRIALLCSNQPPVEFELFKSVPRFSTEDIVKYGRVFSGYSYSAKLILENIDVETSVDVYVNGIPIKSKLRLHEDYIGIEFCDSLYNRNIIFRDCFGFVQLTVEVKQSLEKVAYYTSYAHVFVRNNEESSSIRKMAEYIYSHYDKYLYDTKTQPFDLAALEKNGLQTLDVQIQSLRTILNVYERLQSYFRMNSRFKVEQKETLQNIEKVKSISANTLKYLVQNPQQLVGVSHKTNIRYAHQNFLPQKTLAPSVIKTFDIYENQVVVGFLKQLLSAVDYILNGVRQRMERVPVAKYNVEGYVPSADFIYGGVRKNLERQYQELKDISISLKKMHSAYAVVLKVTDISVAKAPVPTPVFFEVPQYRQVFDIIVRWYQYGLYNFEREDFIYPFLVNNQLYEYYVLLRLATGIEKISLGLKESKKVTYHFRNNPKYKNTMYKNTFVFEGKSKKIVLYYQPVIYGYEVADRNGIDLFRNTSINYPSELDLDEDKEYKTRYNAYYSPDYIIAIQDEDRTQYFILDAKFSTTDVVKRHQVSALTFKYLTSVTPLKENDTIDGLYIICGKSKDVLQRDSIYDTMPSASKIMPRVEVISLVESDSFADCDYQELVAQLLSMNS